MNKRDSLPRSALILIAIVSLSIAAIFAFQSHATHLRQDIVDSEAREEILLTEQQVLLLEKQSLEQDTARMNARFTSAENPWLPDTLVFADLVIPLNDPENWEIRYQLTTILKKILAPRLNRELVLILQRQEYWFPYIDSVIAAFEAPEDLRWLYVQESALNPIVRSSQNAVGIAQFIRSTAGSCGLTVDYWIDERLFPEKAIDASVHCLKKYLEDHNGDVLYAMAVYNGGEGRLQEAIEQHQGSDSSLLNLGYLRPETEKYPYAIFARKLVGENPERYYINYTPGTFNEFPEVTLVDTTFTDYTDISAVADYYGMGHPEFELLHPYIRRSQLLRKDYTFRIPKVYLEQQ